ncbi:malonyl CoA-ACP transacylase [Mycobacterium sp. 236(2023)]|uniref:DUF7158 domain-containing protein n=1 Tax=Mycobacterium sp. 236(2023) TaxID=3038163 RepID=UPI00241562FB|nr:malonyl CoA-ACP transacylase [Mycobacterium sp. 236(2023)]MDG4663882.1 malonyl CoA-ACP transacylase [Mycobacterium sp. 236(2023)]
MTAIAAHVGSEVVTVADVDAREQVLRTGDRRHALPRPGTSEARQMRRWLTQVLVAERVVAMSSRGEGQVPSEADVLPDVVARMELGSVAAATLSDPHGRAVFAAITADIAVTDTEVADYHARNPHRFAVRADIASHLLAAARRRHYRRWLDARCAELTTLAAGYEHPGDPRQPDNTHRH